MLRRKCKITFVSHGSTIYTSENRLYGAENHPPLDETGKAESLRIAEWLKARSPKTDTIYTAPSKRATQTAKYIADLYNMDFCVCESLSSKKEGLWANLTFDDITEKYPETLDKYHEDSVNFKSNDGESLAEYNQRVNRAIEELIDKNIGKRIIVVADSSLIRTVLAEALEIPAKNQSRILVPPASATQINFYKGWSILIYSGYLPL